MKQKKINIEGYKFVFELFNLINMFSFAILKGKFPKVGVI